MANKPVFEAKTNGIRAAVFRNERNDGGSFFNVKLSRSYRDDNGQWKDSSFFGSQQLPIVAKVIQESYAWIKAQQ